MPKINIYVPDELAEAVKESGVPVSAVCQRALEQAVRRVTAIRATTLSELDIDGHLAGMEHYTPRAREAIKLAVAQARAAGAPTVGTEHLLGGILAEGGNLALRILPAIEIEPEQVQRELNRRAGESTEDTPAARFSGEAANALELSVTEATSLGHNYIGCEHLLLGLITEPDGAAGQILRGLGAEARLTRRAMSAALAGFVHLRATTADSNQALVQVMQRLDKLEQRLDAISA